MASAGQVAFFTTPPTVDGDNNLFWNNNAGVKSLRIGARSYIMELPGIPTLTHTATTGGSLSTGTYYYLIVADDSSGREIGVSIEKSITLTAGQNAVALSWSAFPFSPDPNNRYRIYRGTTSGGENVYYETTTGNPPPTSYTDTGAAGTSKVPEVYSADLWITAGAYWDGTYWRRSNDNRTAFGLNLRGYTNVPFESSQGALLWCAVGGTKDTIIDWDLGWDLTAFRDFVIGGFGIEIDGSDPVPYGRFLHHYDTGALLHTVGILTNLFLDLNAHDRDVIAQSWFVGIVGDAFKIRRDPTPAAKDSPINWQDFFHIDSSGKLGIGTTSPVQKLHAIGKLRAESTTNPGRYCELYTDDSNRLVGTNDWYIQTNYDINFLAGGIKRMIINLYGNVGIQTSIPTRNF